MSKVDADRLVDDWVQVGVQYLGDRDACFQAGLSRYGHTRTGAPGPWTAMERCKNRLVIGDEARVVDAFCAWLEGQGWTTQREVAFVDVVGTREGQRLYAEAKGRTASVGSDVDTMYGQLLRRMPAEELGSAIFAVVVPDVAIKAVERVPQRIRAVLGIEIYGVGEDGSVVHVGYGPDPAVEI